MVKEQRSFTMYIFEQKSVEKLFFPAHLQLKNFANSRNKEQSPISSKSQKGTFSS